MPDLSFNSAGLEINAIERFQETCEALKAVFNIQPTGHIDFHLEQFEVFKHYQDVNLRNSYVIKQANNDSYVFFIDTQCKAIGDKGGIKDHCEYQTWALAYLKHDFGRVLIRQETLTDKILELIHPLELDFKDDKAFSDTFYVVVNDHVKANVGIDRNLRNAVMDVRADNFVIEIVDHTLLIGNHKPISPEKAVHLAEFVARVALMC